MLLIIEKVETTKKTAFLELGIFIAFYFTYLFIIHYFKILYCDVLLGLGILAVLLSNHIIHGFSLREMGFTIRNLKVASFYTAIITGFYLIIIFSITYIVKGKLITNDGVMDIIEDIFVYPLWAAIQQYAVIYFYLRIKIICSSPLRSIVFGSLLFALLHAPNLQLMIMVYFAGVGWLYLYEKYENILPIILSHAITLAFAKGLFNSELLLSRQIGAGYVNDLYRMVWHIYKGVWL